MAEAPKYRIARRPYSRLYDIVTENCNPGARAGLTEDQAQASCDLLNLAELNPDMPLTAGFSKVLEGASRGARAKAGYLWRPIATAPPGKFVLVRGPSGYITTKHFVVKAILDTQYREPRWRGTDGDPISDCGWVPEEWMEIPE